MFDSPRSSYLIRLTTGTNSIDMRFIPATEGDFMKATSQGATSKRASKRGGNFLANERGTIVMAVKAVTRLAKQQQESHKLVYTTAL